MELRAWSWRLGAEVLELKVLELRARGVGRAHFSLPNTDSPAAKLWFSLSHMVGDADNRSRRSARCFSMGAPPWFSLSSPFFVSYDSPDKWACGLECMVFAEFRWPRR